MSVALEARLGASMVAAVAALHVSGLSGCKRVKSNVPTKGGAGVEDWQERKHKEDGRGLDGKWGRQDPTLPDALEHQEGRVS